MAEFRIVEREGVRFVAVSLVKDTVRVEAGALAFYRGDITMDARIPRLGTFVTASLSEERAVRPTLSGTGEVVLESSVGGFHILEMRGEEWIIERGGYWASDDEVKVGVYREKVMNAFWSGDGFIEFHTRVRGHGKLVLTARGPAYEVTLAKGERYAAEARGVVIARTSDVTYRVRRPARSILASWLAGDRMLRVFTGPGRILVAPTPYWGAFILEKMGARAEAANAERPAAPAPEAVRAGTA
jgi:uncharacterized protein (AIM24 family)